MVQRSDPGGRRQVGEPETVKAVFDEMPLIMVAFSGPDLRIVAANQAYHSLVGREGNLVGVPLAEAVPELAGQQIHEVLREVYATGRGRVAREWRLQMDVDGTGELKEVFLDFTLSPGRGADGSVVGVRGFATDVTERVREREAAREDAVEAERRYEGAREVVIALQEALLPTALPVLPGARVAARYLVAAEDQAAGGDWFDAIVLADARVALVVGDVVGHGVAASAAMGQLRAVLKHALARESTLVEAVGQVDDFAGSERALRAATLVVVVLDPASGRLEYVTCGHPAPLIAAPDGSTRYLAAAGSGPLGTGSDPKVAEAVLGAGETILLFSDGLVERPGRTIEEGLAELAVVAGDATAGRALPGGAAPTAAERVCQLSVELLTRTGYGDDVTTLAAERLEAPVGDFDLDLVAETVAVPQARRALTAWLNELGSIEDDRFAVSAAVTEVLTNAVEHAYPDGQEGPVRLHAHLGPDGVLGCEVTDRGSWRPPDAGPTHRGRGLLMARQLLDRVQVAHPSAGGTTVRLGHRLHRPAITAWQAPAQAAKSPSDVPFGVDCVPDGAGTVVRVSGAVDLATVDELERILAEVSRGGVVPLSVDLGGATQLASVGVRVLHELRDQLAAHGHNLLVVAPVTSPAHTVLEIVQLAHLNAPAPTASAPVDAGA